MICEYTIGCLQFSPKLELGTSKWVNKDTEGCGNIVQDRKFHSENVDLRKSDNQFLTFVYVGPCP